MIDLIFSWINFAVVLGALILIAYKYRLIPALREGMVQKYRAFEQLSQEQQSLADEQRELEEAILEQEDYAKELFKKTNQWRNVVEIRNKEALKTLATARACADQKAATQHHNYTRSQAAQSILEKVCIELERDARKRFQDPRQGAQEGTAYIERVLKRMERGS